MVGRKVSMLDSLLSPLLIRRASTLAQLVSLMMRGFLLELEKKSIEKLGHCANEALYRISKQGTQYL